MMNRKNTSNIFLRDVEKSDLLVFFEHYSDTESAYMAAFTSKNDSDQDAYLLRWMKMLDNDSIIAKTIVVDENVVGHIARFELFGKPEVTYWIGKEYWGRGIATGALGKFLNELIERPLYARAAKDNNGSIRVLEKSGFKLTGYEWTFANARGEKIEEAVFELK